MPNRYLRQTYIESEAVNAVSMEAESMFVRLIVIVDDWGRCEANVKLLRPKMFPLRLHQVTIEDLQKWMGECVAAGLFVFYTVNGKEYLQMMKWEKGRAESSKFPTPPPEIAKSCLQPYTAVSKSKRVKTDAPDSDSDAGTDNDSDSDVGDKVSQGAKPAAKVELSDDAWLAELVISPAYCDIDVKREYAKMVVWCSNNGKQPSRKRFINWLNRCEKPLKGVVTNERGPNGKQTVWEMKQRKDAIETKMKQIRNRGHEDALSFNYATDKDRQEYQALKTERNKLNESIIRGGE